MYLQSSACAFATFFTLLSIENGFGIIAGGVEHARETVRIQLTHRQHYITVKRRKIYMYLNVCIYMYLSVCVC